MKNPFFCIISTWKMGCGRGQGEHKNASKGGFLVQKKKELSRTDEPKPQRLVTFKKQSKAAICTKQSIP